MDEDVIQQRVADRFLSRCVRRCVLCGWLLFLVVASSELLFATSDSAWSVQYEPKELVNGSPVLFRVKAPATVTSLQGTWADRTFDFRFGRSCECWFAIAGVDLATKPGKQTLELKGSTKDNTALTQSEEILVREKQYPLSTVTLPPAYVQPRRRKCRHEWKRSRH